MPKPQGVNLTGCVVPTDTTDTYPVVDPRWGVDGWRFTASHADRNAIPTLRRREGMIAYCSADQIPWQLKPPPWDGTDNDWVPYGNLAPYVGPVFASFTIRSQPTRLVTGTSVGGLVAFDWTTTVPANIAVNSIAIVDLTTATTIVAGLANTGTYSVTIPTITPGSPATHRWEIQAADIKGNAILAAFTVSWFTASDKVYYVDNSGGSDSNTGLVGHPWLTLQHAADTVDVGDTVHVAVGSGPYAGFTLGWDVTGSPSGAASHPISFLFDPGATVNRRNSRTFDAIDIEGCSFITIRGSTIANDGTVTRSGIRCSGGTDGIGNYGNQFLSNTIVGTGRFGINGGFCNDSLVQGNVISGILAGGGNTTGHGVYMANSMLRCTIRLNTITGCGNNAIHTNGDISQGGAGIAQDCLIERNYIYGNALVYQGGAVNCDGIVNSRIQNNLIAGQSDNGIALFQGDSAFGSSGNVVCNNTVLINSLGKWPLNINTNSTGNTAFGNILCNLVNFGGSNACGAVTIDLSSLDGFASDYNIFSNALSSDGQQSIGNLTTWQNSTGGDLHSAVVTSLTPMFQNPNGVPPDYHNLSTAPQTNDGIGTLAGHAAPAEDLDGTARPFGGAYDAGCYEFNPNLPSVLLRVPTPGTAGVVPIVTATFNSAITPGSSTFVVKTAAGTMIPGTVTDNGTNTFTFTPTSRLPVLADYVASISGVTDGSGNVMAGAVSWGFTTADLPNLGPFSLFPASFVPSTGVSTGYFDSGGTECGMRFSSDVTGSIVGVRFFKSTDNTGTHTIHLWSNTGTSLATATASGEAANGWQSQGFAAPVGITPSTVYVASYYAPGGHYSVDPGYFASARVNGVITGKADVPAGNRNGVTAFGSAFPATVGGSGVAIASSYGVDVLFDSRNPYPGATGTPLAGVVTFTFNVPISSGVVFHLKDGMGFDIAGTLTPGSSTYMFTPTVALGGNQTVTASVSGAVDAAGNAMSGTTSWSFTTVAPATPHTLWNEGSTAPGTIDQGDGTAYTLGVVFQSTTPGQVTKVSFYKSAANAGAHVGALWDGSGTLLSSATFSGETPSGWQTVILPAGGVAILANTKYVVGVLMPVGHYSYNAGYFAAGYTNGDGTLSVPATPALNSVLNSGSSLAYPNTPGGGNFWVDVTVEF